MVLVLYCICLMLPIICNFMCDSLLTVITGIHYCTFKSLLNICRYGLPVNFQAILVHPNKKSIKRLRDTLNQLYAHLDSSATGGAGEVSNLVCVLVCLLVTSLCSLVEGKVLVT